MQSPVKQVKALAKVVAEAFSRADLTPEELNSSILKFDDLPWACPPLKIETEIDHVPLSYYMDVAMPVVSSEVLYSFWRTTLGELYQRKRHIIQHGAFLNLRRVAPKSSLGQRALRFALPGGFPVELADTTGIEFSIDAAHTALLSCPLSEHVSDDNNYFVVTASGHTIGVKDGKPAVESEWDMPATGMIGEMLLMPRGHTDYVCLYDQIARCRSLLHEYRSRFKEFEGLDYALQGLRKLTLGGHCPALISAVQIAPIDTQVMRARELAVRQAMDVMAQPNVMDRAKIRTIEQLLVPLILSPSAFSQKVYNTTKPIPFSVTDKATDKINEWLGTYYNTKIPDNMKG